jgi:hypothetical protein
MRQAYYLHFIGFCSNPKLLQTRNWYNFFMQLNEPLHLSSNELLNIGWAPVPVPRNVKQMLNNCGALPTN